MITKQQYVEYLLAKPMNHTGTNMVEHLEDVSHDAFSDYLRREHHTTRTAWELDQPLLCQYLGAVHGLVRGIGVINLVQSTGQDGDFFPIDNCIYAPETDGKTKNDHFREMLLAAVNDKQLQSQTMLFDTW